MTVGYSSPAFIPQPHLHEESDRDDTLILISGAFHNTSPISTQGDRGKIVPGYLGWRKRKGHHASDVNATFQNNLRSMRFFR